MELTEINVKSIEGRRHFTVRDEYELDRLTQVFVRQDMGKEVKKLEKEIKKAILKEFNDSVSTSTSSMTFIKGNAPAAVRDQIRESIRNMKLKRKYAAGNRFRFEMVLNDSTGGLIKALNNGTGIYNKENPKMITAKNKKYMFIPGAKFAQKSFAKQVSKPAVREIK